MCNMVPEQAIRLFGTDFSLMERMFPGRPRKALKNKLQREYRADRARVDAALAGGDDTSSVDKLKEVAGMLRQVRAASAVSAYSLVFDAMLNVRAVWSPSRTVKRTNVGRYGLLNYTCPSGQRRSS